MTCEEFVNQYQGKGLPKKQELNLRAIKKLVLRAGRDMKQRKRFQILECDAGFEVL